MRKRIKKKLGQLQLWRVDPSPNERVLWIVTNAGGSPDDLNSEIFASPREAIVFMNMRRGKKLPR